LLGRQTSTITDEYLQSDDVLQKINDFAKVVRGRNDPYSRSEEDFREDKFQEHQGSQYWKNTGTPRQSVDEPSEDEYTNLLQKVLQSTWHEVLLISVQLSIAFSIELNVELGYYADVRLREIYRIQRKMWQNLKSNVKKFMRPKACKGFRRLEWTCVCKPQNHRGGIRLILGRQICGEPLYGDYLETRPGSLDGLAARLAEISKGPVASPESLKQSTQAGTTEGSVESPSAPQPSISRSKKAHTRPSDQSRPVGWQSPSATSDNSPGANAPASSTGNPPPEQVANRFLGLCLKSGKFSHTLREVKSSQSRSQDDGYLFQSIRNAYEDHASSFLQLQWRFNIPTSAIYVKVCNLPPLFDVLGVKT
jgi:hypothetical protein